MPGKKLCLFLLLASFFIYAITAEDADIKTITSSLEKFRKNYPQEKVHLHLDKPYYSIGDTIYFSGYVVNAEKNTPSVISNILYVDLINDSNNVLQTLKFAIMDGNTYGMLPIGDSLHEGKYRIRAYTNWMRNFDDAFFFDDVIAIGNGFNGELTATSVFQFSNINKSPDSLSIQYASLYNIPVESRDVSYSFVISKKEKINGSGITDNDGAVHINLAGLKLPHDQPVLLVTHVKLDNKTTITKEIQLNIPNVKNTIHFFPEGGQMVAGLASRIGFKAMNADGLGTDVAGEIKDDSTNEIITIRSGFAGIGSFLFTPQPKRSYHASIQYEDGSKDNVALPEAEMYGYVLSVDNSGVDSISIHINSKMAAPPGKIIIVGQTNNRIQFAEPVLLTDGSTRISLSKKKWPTGIMQFTLFDSTLQPVAERLAFINHHDELTFNITLDKPSYAAREKATMQLNVKDEKGEPVSGTFSLAVTDANTVAEGREKKQTILSDLLLTSDIKGYVEDANHYFNDKSETAIKELDDLLLTQGWRRFAWKDVLAGKDPQVSFSREKSLSVNGKLVSSKGQSVEGKHILLLPKKERGFILDTVTDSYGNFTFDDLNFNEDYPFVLQIAAADNSDDAEIKLTGFSPPPASDNKNQPEMGQPSNNIMLPYLAQSRERYDVLRKYGLLERENQLKDVVVTTKQLTKVQEAVASSYNLNGPGNADQILTYADLINCHDVNTCLQGKITGVYFKMVLEDPAAYVKVWHLLPFLASGMGKPMTVVLDGSYLTAENRTLDMRNIPAQNIQSIEVLRSGGYLNVYGVSGSGGVLVITTKQGGIDYDAARRPATKPLEDVVFTTAKGYASYREFYMPDYADPAVYAVSIPDKRNTIYWKPVITTDDNGNAVVDWYNADNKGNCNIVIEGLSGKGKLGHASFNYKMR